MGTTGHGHNTRIAIGEQNQWGVPVARTLGLRVLEETLQLKQAVQQKAVLGYTSQHVQIKGKRGAEGGLKLYLPPNGGELLLKHALGAKNTVPGNLDGGGNYYTHTFSLATALLPGLSIEADRDAAAVGTAWLYDSCRVNKFTLAQALEDGLTLALDVLGRDETKVAATGGLTHPALRTFDWDECVVTVAGQPIDLESLEITGEQALDGDRHKLGSNLRRGISRKEPRKLSGKLEGELDGATFYDLFRDVTECELVAVWTGALLGQDTGADVFTKLTVTLPRITFTGETPNTKDAGRIKLSLPFVAAAEGDVDNSELIVALTNSTA